MVSDSALALRKYYMISKENYKNLPNVIFTTLLIEKSPQAIPLGAACVASAVKNHKKTKDLCKTTLLVFNKEDKSFINNSISKFRYDEKGEIEDAKS